MKRYKMTIEFESRYDEKTQADIDEMKEKLINCFQFIRADNNTSRRYVGLHATMGLINVEEVD